VPYKSASSIDYFTAYMRSILCRKSVRNRLAMNTCLATWHCFKINEGYF